MLQTTFEKSTHRNCTRKDGPRISTGSFPYAILSQGDAFLEHLQVLQKPQGPYQDVSDFPEDLGVQTMI
jgi:hypothetical protein